MSTFSRVPTVRICWNAESAVTQEKLVSLLTVLGDLLPDPLSARISLDDYAAKLLRWSEIGCAYFESEIVGLVALYANDQTTGIAYISLLALLPAYQGQGIGRALMLQAIDIARENGMRRVVIKVHQNNAVAQRLYNSLGFKIFSYDARKLTMSLELAPEAQ